MRTVQLIPVDTSQPAHPTKLDPRWGLAVKVTSVPAAKSLDRVQVRPPTKQLIPAGDEVTDPAPDPDLTAVNVYMVVARVVACATLEYAELPPALVARTW
jgi:hypothetical protein